MLKENNMVGRGNGRVHRMMMQYMLSCEMFREVADVCACHALLPKTRTPDLFTVLDSCDNKLSCDERPKRPTEVTVMHALKNM